MALIRCPIHKIPYNDANPRGCPACAREKEGGGEHDVMRELARATRASRGIPAPPAEVARRSTAGTARPSLGMFPGVTDAPRLTEVPEGFVGRLVHLARERRGLTMGWVAIAVLALIVAVTSRPSFVEAPDPPPAPEQARDLPVEPFALVTSVFSMLGPQQPEAVPDAPQLARYSYGTQLQIDALNRRVYAITIGVPSRTWKGLQVGMPERTVNGTLALLGPVHENSPSGFPAPQQVHGYAVYPSLNERPRRTLVVEVRPPNGCFDATVDLQPQAVGILRSGGRRLAVIGQGDTPLNWVATRIRIISRAVSGPYGGVAC